MLPSHRKSLALIGRLLDRLADSSDVRLFELFKRHSAAAAFRVQLTVDLDTLDVHNDIITEQRFAIEVSPGTRDTAKAAETLEHLVQVFVGETSDGLDQTTVVEARDAALTDFIAEVRKMHR